MRSGQGSAQMLALPKEPFTLVIELDAWNIRERDDWGQSAQKRAAGKEPQRWHWAYGGTCFQLDQRVESPSGRARILSRGTVMTRGGVEGLREQLFAEAQRHGLAQAAKALVIADGAFAGFGIWRATVLVKLTSGWTTITPASICGQWPMPSTRRMKPVRGSGSSRCSRSSRRDVRPRF